MKHRSDHDDDGWSQFLGFGFCHTLREFQPGPDGKWPKVKKRPRIGFHLPKPPKGERK